MHITAKDGGNTGMDRNDLIREYQAVERDIRQFNRGTCSAFYFLRHVLGFLRQHPALCEQSDYRELYDETVVLLILQAHANCDWTQSSPSDQQGCVELLTDLESNYTESSFASFTMEIIDCYLAYRKKQWVGGRKYTKEYYGFQS